MNVFGAITIGVFLASAVAAARLAEAWLPKGDSIVRGLVVVAAGLLGGFGATGLYFAFLSNRAKAHAARQVGKVRTETPARKP